MKTYVQYSFWSLIDYVLDVPASAPTLVFDPEPQKQPIPENQLSFLADLFGDCDETL